MEIKCIYKTKILLFWSDENGNTSEKNMFKSYTEKLGFLYIKLTEGTFSTQFCPDRCNWGTMRFLEDKKIKIKHIIALKIE